MSKPLVGIIMGSQSDLKVMSKAAEVLKKFDVPFEVTVVSAHRTPDRLVSYAKSASGRGIKVIIAGAGGAAHLPGMAASLTELPVIGVPVLSRISLVGLDSLLSIVQMPPGVPVATVAINGADNAGLLAVQILSTANPKLQSKMKQYKSKLRRDVMASVRKIKTSGYKKVLESL